ncbi:SgcJ/EcaC family oxidoreductase [Allokutzneria oryzae]|uniref:SgcJ/EcaC family oxidoreductase n=1 Tax=Allokutzneria oryzae TaxID=1378989 RepID=A0ABV6A0L4_9PSEU
MATTAVVAGSGASAFSSPSATSEAGSATAEARLLPTAREIRAQFDSWNHDLVSGDVNKVVHHYAHDAVLLPTLSNEVRTTRDGIKDYFTEFMAKKPTGAILHSYVNVQSDHSAVDAGTYRFTFGDGTHTDARYTFVYEKRHGQWVIINHHSSKMPQG